MSVRPAGQINPTPETTVYKTLNNYLESDELLSSLPLPLQQSCTSSNNIDIAKISNGQQNSAPKAMPACSPKKNLFLCYADAIKITGNVRPPPYDSEQESSSNEVYNLSEYDRTGSGGADRHFTGQFTGRERARAGTSPGLEGEW